MSSIMEQDTTPKASGAEEIARGENEDVSLASLKFPQIAAKSENQVAILPKTEQAQGKDLQLKVHELGHSTSRSNSNSFSKSRSYATKQNVTEEDWGRPARNIQELEQKFQTVYVQSSVMSQTQRSQSHHFNGHIDRKITNIMQKLNSRFDRHRHKQRNEELVDRLRRKAHFESSQRNLTCRHDRKATTSQDLIAVTEVDRQHQPPADAGEEHQ